MTNQQQVQHLRGAAELISTYGLAKGSYRAKERLDCAHCTMGAVIDIVDPVFGYIAQGPFRPKFVPILTEVAKTIDPDYRGNFFNIIAPWNDHPDRTADEVVAVLKATADRLEDELAEPQKED